MASNIRFALRFYETNNSAKQFMCSLFCADETIWRRAEPYDVCIVLVYFDIIRCAFGISPEYLWWLSTRNLNFGAHFCLVPLSMFHHDSCSFFSHFVEIRAAAAAAAAMTATANRTKRHFQSVWKRFAGKCKIISAPLVFPQKSMLNVFEGFSALNSHKLHNLNAFECPVFGIYYIANRNVYASYVCVICMDVCIQVRACSIPYVSQSLIETIYDENSKIYYYYIRT